MTDYTIDDLLQLMARLRDPQGGCPWDLEQDFHSIVPSTLEECYELAQAIAEEDFPHVAEELGDVLFQVVFYSQLGSEQGLFDFNQVISTLVEKLIRRHPHVFADGSIDGHSDRSVSVEEVKTSWEAIKQSERKAKNNAGVLADIPLALPALSRAQKLQKRAAGVGFDWPDHDELLPKLDEEIVELKQALASNDKDGIEEEIGDLMFTVVNLCRHLGLNAEASLRRASGKFERRFQCMESAAQNQDQQLQDLSAAELDKLWNQAKFRLSKE